jgi:hypothetical protein
MNMEKYGGMIRTGKKPIFVHQSSLKIPTTVI